MRRDPERGRLPAEVPEWMHEQGVAPGPFDAVVGVGPGTEALPWVILGVVGVPGTIVVTMATPTDPDPWLVAAFILFLAGLVAVAQWVGVRAVRGRWLSTVGQAPAPDMVMALTSQYLLVWPIAFRRRARLDPVLLIRADRHEIRARRRFAYSLSFDVMLEGGTALTFHSDLAGRRGSDRIIAMLNQTDDATDPTPSS